MEPTAVRSAADLLLSAYSSGTPVTPLIDEYPDADVTDAYRIQQEQVRRWTKAATWPPAVRAGPCSDRR
jgi:2-keto-4-pentenoate hydratase